jgi:hypothetical protein
MKRETGTGEKQPKGLYMKIASELKAFVKSKLPGEDLNFIAMSKPIAGMLKAANNDLDRAKKNFDSTNFMKEYNSAKADIDSKKAAKKRSKE